MWWHHVATDANTSPFFEPFYPLQRLSEHPLPLIVPLPQRQLSFGVIIPVNKQRQRTTIRSKKLSSFGICIPCV
jgi:hypothetical protein